MTRFDRAPNLTARVRRRLHAAGIGVAAFVLLAGDGACLDVLIGFGSLLTANQATITVDNLSDETLFVVLSAQDAYAGSSLPPGGHASIKTHTEGTYHVVVRMSDDELVGYHSELNELNRLTQELHLPRLAGDAPDELVRQLDQTKRKLNAIRRSVGTTPTGGASCAGTVDFPETVPENPQPIRKSAQVYRGPDGELGASCG